jgi:hypothetical protein
MGSSQLRFAALVLAASGTFLLGSARGDQEPAPKTGERATPTTPAEAPKQGREFDPNLVSAGMAAFERNCTSCHHADRALSRTKDLQGWRTTVRRMASMRGANISSEDWEPIATYLASTSGGAGTERSGADAKDDAGTFSAFASLAPVWRGGRNELQNPGFFPDMWVGGAWQGKILSGRVTACASCHGVHEESGLSRVELVEAVARVDLTAACECLCTRGTKASLEAGRFVVPFGAFSAQVNPGLYRAVTAPLIFNMGQRLEHHNLGHGVLPMPYADEGVNLNVEVPVTDCATPPVTAAFDAYLVNGLAGITEVDFEDLSRHLVDNNRRVAVGGRFSVGQPNLRAGASITHGRFNDPAGEGEFPEALSYTIYGFDVQARYKDLLRFQFEYARRGSDRVSEVDEAVAAFTEHVDGYYVEVEARPCENFPVSVFGRYDRLRHQALLPSEESMVGLANFTVQRVTVGVNIVLWRQSLLILNDEYWILPDPLPSQHVFGVRYAITF